MAKKKEKSLCDVQSRHFKLLLYPDNPLHMQVLQALPVLFSEHLGILHNANPERKEHYHVLLSVGDCPRKLGTVARQLGFVNDLGEPDFQFVRVCDGRIARFLVYLTHLDQPEKEQYSASELFGSSSLLADYGKAATKFLRSEFDMADCVLACLDWIKCNHDNVITMTAFARWICGTPYFKASSSPIVRACIDEHNQRIYNAYRGEYIRSMSDSQEKYQALLSHPEADPAPPTLPDDFNIDDMEVLY